MRPQPKDFFLAPERKRERLAKDATLVGQFCHWVKQLQRTSWHEKERQHCSKRACAFGVFLGLPSLFFTHCGVFATSHLITICTYNFRIKSNVALRFDPAAGTRISCSFISISACFPLLALLLSIFSESERRAVAVGVAQFPCERLPGLAVLWSAACPSVPSRAAGRWSRIDACSPTTAHQIGFDARFDRALPS
jgi:hypothetical protein